MINAWLHALSIASLALAGLCTAIIALDVARHPQKMAIMNIAWPVTALFGSLLVLAAYVRYGRGGASPFAAQVATGTLHCGSGCTLGDMAAEFLALAAPSVAVAFGWHWLFGMRMFAVWVLDYVFAYAFGIVFQYFSIVPMRGLSFRAGIIAAIKADTLSLTAWQIGMYGFMAFATFALFGHPLAPDSAVFWWMMQLAMLCGFATAYPVNWWLIRSGLKEAM